MIKINLATKKQAVGVSEKNSDGSTKSAFKIDARLDGLRELPIKKFALAAVACFMASYTLDSFKAEELAKWDAQIAAATENNTNLKKELAKTKGFDQEKKALDADELLLKTKIETIETLIRNRDAVPKIFNGLSAGIPKDVWISALKISAEEANLKGSSVGYTPISDFMRSLNESAYFQDVRLVNSQEDRDEAGASVANFELAAKRR